MGHSRSPESRKGAPPPALLLAAATLSRPLSPSGDTLIAGLHRAQTRDSMSGQGMLRRPGGMERMRRFRIGGDVYADEGLELQAALAAAYLRKERLLCLCRDPGCAMPALP